MRQPKSRWIVGLELAARAPDEGEFDAALDDLLERARDEANPAGDLRALVGARLEAELAVENGAAQLTKSGAAGLATALRTGVRPVAAVLRAGRVSRWLHYARGLGLVATGVAIGFLWGRSGVWPGDARDASGFGAGTASTADAPLAQEGSGAQPPSAPAREAPAPNPLGRDSDPPGAERIEARAARPAPNVSVPRAATRRASDARSVPRSDADELRFVLEQLRKAQLFLRAHEPARALAALDAIDARVPARVLQEERDVTRTLALCDSGETAKAKELARGVLERAPQSPYGVSLRESCAGPEDQQLLEQMRARTSNAPR